MSIFCDFQLNILCTLLKQSCLTGLECVGHIKLKRTYNTGVIAKKKS